MLWTIYNKHKVNNVLEDTLKAEHISYSRYMTNPSILNNILWTGTVETDSAFLTGQYSLLDKERKFKLYKIPKGHELLGDTEGDEVIDILKWFSNDYFAVIKRQDGKLQLNDMRYGTFRGKPEGENSYIFKFALERGNDGNYQLDEATGGPPRGGEDRLMGELWNRIKGI